MQSSRTPPPFSREHTKWCMCGDHCQRWSRDNRGQSVSQSEKQEARGGGNENKEDSSLFFLNIIFINIPSSYTDNHCQCSTWSLVSRQLLPEGSATRASPFFRQMLSDCRAFKHDSCVSLTCIKCPSPLTLECYIAKEGSYFIYRSLILFLNICGALRPGSQSHYAL